MIDAVLIWRLFCLFDYIAQSNYCFVQTKLLTVHGKTTDEWHTDDIRVHTSDIWMTYEWHTSTSDWDTNGIRVHIDKTQAHANDMRMTWEMLNRINDLELLDCNFQNYLL